VQLANDHQNDGGYKYSAVILSDSLFVKLVVILWVVCDIFLPSDWLVKRCRDYEEEQIASHR